MVCMSTTGVEKDIPPDSCTQNAYTLTLTTGACTLSVWHIMKSIAYSFLQHAFNICTHVIWGMLMGGAVTKDHVFSHKPACGGQQMTHIYKPSSGCGHVCITTACPTCPFDYPGWHTWLVWWPIWLVSLTGPSGNGPFDRPHDWAVWVWPVWLALWLACLRLVRLGIARLAGSMTVVSGTGLLIWPYDWPVWLSCLIIRRGYRPSSLLHQSPTRLYPVRVASCISHPLGYTLSEWPPASVDHLAIPCQRGLLYQSPLGYTLSEWPPASVDHLAIPCQSGLLHQSTTWLYPVRVASYISRPLGYTLSEWPPASVDHLAIPSQSGLLHQSPTWLYPVRAWVASCISRTLGYTLSEWPPASVAHLAIPCQSGLLHQSSTWLYPVRVASRISRPLGYTLSEWPPASVTYFAIPCQSGILHQSPTWLYPVTVYSCISRPLG